MHNRKAILKCGERTPATNLCTLRHPGGFVLAEKSQPKLLIIDDDVQSVALLAEALAQNNLEIITATDPEAGLELVRREAPEIVLLDLVMPNIGGMVVLERILQRDPGTDVILMTGQYSPESAVQAIRSGASDYLTKPLDLNLLRARIGKLTSEIERRNRALRLDQELVEAFQFEDLIGRSPAMLSVFDTVRRVAPHFRSVLVTGATGTGKELLARALHRLSPAAARQFAVCNCSALVDSLVETELFGYVRGAFTGAQQDRIGVFEYANGGVVFLDEIGEMPLAAQAKLLRVLQQQELQRVGSPEIRKVDVRVIAATNRNVRSMIAEGKFREDLFYRLSMVQIELPALVARQEDLPLLERHFVQNFAKLYKKPIAGITHRAQALLAKYHWPGNVRELENVIGNACMMTEDKFIDIRDFPGYFRTAPPQEIVSEELPTLAELQRRHVVRVLELVGNDKARAAKILGISRATMYNMAAKLQISTPSNENGEQ